MWMWTWRVSREWKFILVCDSVNILRRRIQFHFTDANVHFPIAPCPYTPQWGAANAEIKVPSAENTELKRSPFKAWSRSIYSHKCYVYCQEFLPCLFLTFQSIHLHFFQNLSRFFLCWLWVMHGSCVGPQNKIGHPARCRFPCWVPTE